MGVAGFLGLVGNCEGRSGSCGSSRVVTAGEGFGGGWCSSNCGRVSGSSGSSGSSRLVAAGLGERSGGECFGSCGGVFECSGSS